MKKKILIIVLFMLGLALLLYPLISNCFFSQMTQVRIESHEIKFNDMTVEEVDAELNKAIKYNEAIFAYQNKKFDSEKVIAPILDEYEEILNIDGMMCVIEIPKINVILSIYHGTSEEVLNKGVGHIRETSLPVGGNGTHSYLTAHTGFPGAKLFSDLDDLQTGDRFYICVLGEKLVYSVDKITVLAADDASTIEIDEDSDYVTLITCTPEGINSHRLLVRGTRVSDMPSQPAEVASNAPRTFWWIIPIIVFCIFVLIVIIRKSNKIKTKSR